MYMYIILIEYNINFSLCIKKIYIRNNILFFGAAVLTQNCAENEKKNDYVDVINVISFCVSLLIRSVY